eukprot:tig00001187_g7472.t1
MEGAAGAELNWVQCDGCGKWRRLPSDVEPSSLPDTWKCSDTWWDEALAAVACNAPEEEWQAAPAPAAPPPDDDDDRPLTKRKRGRAPKPKRPSGSAKSQGSSASDALACQACEGINETESFVCCGACGAAWHCYCLVPPLSRPSADFLCGPCAKARPPLSLSFPPPSPIPFRSPRRPAPRGRGPASRAGALTAGKAAQGAGKRRKGRAGGPGAEREAQRYFAVRMPYTHEHKARLALSYLTGAVEAEVPGELAALAPRDLLLLVWGVQALPDPAPPPGPGQPAPPPPASPPATRPARVRVALVGSVVAAEAEPPAEAVPAWPGSRPPLRRVVIAHRRIFHNAQLPGVPAALLAPANVRAVSECGPAPFEALLEPEEAAQGQDHRPLQAIPISKRILVNGRGDPPKPSNALCVEVLVPGSHPRRRLLSPGFEPPMPELGAGAEVIVRGMREGELCELRDEGDPSKPPLRARLILSCGAPFPPSPAAVFDLAPEGGSPPLFLPAPPPGGPEEKEARRRLVERVWSETVCRVLERLYRGCAVQLEAEVARPFAAGLGLARSVDPAGRVTLEPTPFETVRELRAGQYEARELPLRRAQLERLVKAAVDARGLNRIARRLVEEMARFLYKYSRGPAGPAGPAHAPAAVKREEGGEAPGPPAPDQVCFAFEIEGSFFGGPGDDARRRLRNRTESERILRRLGFDTPNGEVSEADPSSLTLTVSASNRGMDLPVSLAAEYWAFIETRLVGAKALAAAPHPRDAATWDLLEALGAPKPDPAAPGHGQGHGPPEAPAPPSPAAAAAAARGSSDWLALVRSDPFLRLRESR